MAIPERYAVDRQAWVVPADALREAVYWPEPRAVHVGDWTIVHDYALGLVRIPRTQPDGPSNPDSAVDPSQAHEP